jgi:hypothetical protein
MKYLSQIGGCHVDGLTVTGFEKRNEMPASQTGELPGFALNLIRIYLVGLPTRLT